MKRKALALLLGVSMVASALSGCGAKEKETEKVTEKVTEATTEVVTEAETEAATEAVTEAQTEKVTEAATEAETEAATEKATEAETEEVTEAVTEEVVTEVETETEAVLEALATEAETEEVTEAVTEEATEEVTEEATEEATEEVIEEATEEATEAVTEEVTEIEEATEAVTEAAAEEETEEVTEEATEEATEEVTEEATEEVTEAATEEVTEAATEEVTEEVTEEATEEVTEEATEAATEEVTEEETEAAEIEYSVALAEAVTGTVEDMAIEENDIVVLFNNDVHGGISADEDYSGSADSLGYAGMAAVKAEVTELAGNVTTVDLGDAIQGSVVTTESDGQDAMDLMAKVGYDICIPGNHEFDYGMELFLDYAESSDADFPSCNFIDLESGETIFDGYKVVTYDVDGTEFNVGYVAISTPETIAKSTPTYFQDEEGNFIYGFDAETPEDLYEAVQTAVDAAKEEGADCIVALSHLGDTGVESDWSSISVAANTNGIDVILDGHAHSTIAGDVITNMDGEDVLLTSTGTKLENIGVLKLSVGEDGVVTAATGLVNELTEEETASDAYVEMEEMVNEIQEQYAYLFEVVGSVDFDLVIYDPADGGETRLIRTTETNMGDFLTDVYRSYFGTDIAIMNGGSIRANISAGDITYMDLITVYPWNTEVGVIEVTGQQMLDCLEMGAHLYPEECGGFIQVSGLTYAIDTTIPSSVNVNSDGEFVSVDGEYRVKNVMVGEEELDLEKTYTLAINRYYSEECGDGMTMFKGSNMLVPAEGEEWEVDHDVVIAYLASVDGKVSEEYADPYGQGRISFIVEEEEVATEAQAVTADKKEEKEEETEEVTEEVTEVLEALTEAETEAVTEAATEAATEVATEAVTEAETETETEA